MNLKEAFRFQNKLQRLMEEAQDILVQERNVVRVEKTALLHKVNPEAADETTMEQPATAYADQINGIVGLLMFLLDQRERLSEAIRAAKRTLDMDFDGEVSLNTRRQEIAATFRRMSQIRSHETLQPNGGVGYKFNAEGNQVSYRCDLKTVTTINFDRNKVRACAALLSRRADETSAALDRAMVTTQVAYAPPFDVNDTFADVLQQHTAGTA